MKSRNRATASYSCPECGFALHYPIAEIGVSSLGLYDDARFPGRCILVYRKHVEEFSAIAESEAAAFIEDVRRAARAIVAAVTADRMNYAISRDGEAPSARSPYPGKKRMANLIPTQAPMGSILNSPGPLKKTPKNQNHFLESPTLLHSGKPGVSSSPKPYKPILWPP